MGIIGLDKVSKTLNGKAILTWMTLIKPYIPQLEKWLVYWVQETTIILYLFTD